MPFERSGIVAASVIAFIAWGLAIQQLPILRFLGYAFVAGACITTLVVLLLLLSIRSPRQNALWRHSEFRLPASFKLGNWSKEVQWLQEQESYKKEALYPASFVVSEALDTLISQILRDLVSSWYIDISKRSNFVHEIEKSIHTALCSIRNRLLEEDVVEIMVLRIVPLVTKHLKELYDAERAVRGPNLDRNVTESEELDIAIARKYRDGNLHAAVPLAYSDLQLVQREYLRKMVARILPELLPETFLHSRSVAILVKEIVSCAILAPIMQLLSEPDTWNQLLEAYARVMLQDRKTVRKLRAALDQHTTLQSSPAKQRMLPQLTSNSDERQYERLVRAIKQIKVLSDARRIRSDVASQIKRVSLAEAPDQVLLRRLETAKYLLDQKISRLTTSKAVAAEVAHSPSVEVRDNPLQSKKASIIDVLHHPAGLSYFMEYMDRRNRMALVQFWIVVEGFRDPLEDGIDPTSPTSGALSHWKQSDRSDLAQIYEAYLSKPEFKVPEKSKRAIENFLESGESATDAQFLYARQAVMRSHAAVLEELQDTHFPNFKKSDLYYKYLSSESPTLQRLKAASKPLRPPSISPIAENHIAKPSLSRASSAATTEKINIRRNAASSSDLRLTSDIADPPMNQSRRSLDEVNISGPLFNDNDQDEDPLARSTQSLGQGSFNGEDDEDSRDTMVEAMGEALNDIMAHDKATQDGHPSLFDTSDTLFPANVESDSLHTSGEIVRVESGFSDKGREKPNLASLGLVNSAGRIGVFTDNDLFGDEAQFSEDEHADEDKASDPRGPEEEVQEAAPGDLGLAEAISALAADIERLVAQESVVDSLTRKAELTNNTAELRILGKSKSSLQREIRRKGLQRQQYIVQEGDNSLYGKADVHIKSIMVGREDDGQEYALYVVEVTRQASEQTPTASWAVARRYSEFHELHQRLRRYYPIIRHLEFPRRRLVMKLQRDFLEKRRLALQSYLRELLRLPAVCRSRDLRAFLSQRAIGSMSDTSADGAQRDIISRIYSSVADGMDEFFGNIPVLDQLSVAGQNLISAATSQLNTGTTVTPTSSIMAAAAENESNLLSSSAEARAELLALDTSTPAQSSSTASLETAPPFVKPISDIFLEMFSLNRGNSWLRGRAVVVVLHQLLGGTVERRTRDLARSLVTEENLLKYLNLAKDTFYPPEADGSPGHALKREWPPRTQEQKAKSKREASVLLATLIPDLAGNVVGRSNAQEAGRKIFAMMNNGRLLGHLVFTIFDRVVDDILLGGGQGSGSSRGGVKTKTKTK